MATLEIPKLGTDPEKGWPFYALHMTASYVIREGFFVNNYIKSIDETARKRAATERLKSSAEEWGILDDRNRGDLERSFAHIEWAEKMQEEKYHELYVLALIGMWSALETGIENSFSDFIYNDKNLAVTLSGMLKRYKGKIESYPWSKEECLSLAQKLEGKAKSSVGNGDDYFSRLVHMYGWVGVNFSAEEDVRESINEANKVRNILMHRYGKVDHRDAVGFPNLEPWVGRNFPVTKKDFKRYFNAASKTISAIMTGVIEWQKEVDRSGSGDSLRK